MIDPLACTPERATVDCGRGRGFGLLVEKV